MCEPEHHRDIEATAENRTAQQPGPTEEGPDMIALLVITAFIVFVEVAAIRGWGADSRDGRDWTVKPASRGRHGAVHPPASWLK